MTGICDHIFRIIESFHNIRKEMFFPDQLDKVIFFHNGHRLFVDM